VTGQRYASGLRNTSTGFEDDVEGRKKNVPHYLTVTVTSCIGYGVTSPLPFHRLDLMRNTSHPLTTDLLSHPFNLVLD
jgi:hypothetical protein